MGDDFVSVSRSEAESIIKMLKTQSNAAKDAIKKVMDARNNLTKFRGSRAEQFKENTENQMRKLMTALDAIDVLAKEQDAAKKDILDAGSRHR
jgi:hypothetical protein